MISVIIPAYNIEPYLDRCLKSVVAQEGVEMEILVVDDGSTDGTPAIADDWARRDERVKVIHQTNSGLSEARNAALDVAKGRFITFVDGDDLLAPDALRVMRKVIEQSETDVVVGKTLALSDEDANRFMPENSESKPTLWHYTSRETLLQIFYQKKITQSAWSRLFRRELFDTLRFPADMLYEDLAVAYPLYSSIRRLTTVDTLCYLYVDDRPGSILNHFNARREHVLDILDNLLEQVKDEAPWLVGAVTSRRLSAAFNMLRLAPKGDKRYDDLRRRAWSIITQSRRRCLTDPNVRLKNKIGILASFLGKKMIAKVF